MNFTSWGRLPWGPSISTPSSSSFSSFWWKVKAKKVKWIWWRGGTLCSNKLIFFTRNSEAPQPPSSKKQFLIKNWTFSLHCFSFYACFCRHQAVTQRKILHLLHSRKEIDQVLIKFYASLTFFSFSHSTTPIDFPYKKRSEINTSSCNLWSFSCSYRNHQFCWHHHVVCVLLNLLTFLLTANLLTLSKHSKHSKDVC